MSINEKAFRKALPNLVKYHKGSFVSVKNGIVSQPYKTFSEASIAAYTKPGEHFLVCECVYDKDLKHLPC